MLFFIDEHTLYLSFLILSGMQMENLTSRNESVERLLLFSFTSYNNGCVQNDYLFTYLPYGSLRSAIFVSWISKCILGASKCISPKLNTDIIPFFVCLDSDSSTGFLNV